MAARIPHRCSYPGCRELITDGPRCAEHKAQSSREHIARRRYKIDEGSWKLTKDVLKANGNTICQRVIDGERCRMPVWGFHHVIEVEIREDLAFHQENIVGLCKACHNTVTFGGAEEAIYVPTLWRTPMSDEPMPPITIMPGAMLTREQEEMCWTLANRLALFQKEAV